MEEKKYRVVKDLLGGDFGTGRDYTIDEWREQASEWCDMDENFEYGNHIMKELPKDKVIEEIADNWSLKIEEVKTSIEEFIDLFNNRLSSYGEDKNKIKDIYDYTAIYNYITNEDNELYEEETNDLLKIFYKIEDKNGYKIKNISKIINYLQKDL